MSEKRNTSEDVKKTKELINNLQNDDFEYYGKDELIDVLKRTPEMLEFGRYPSDNREYVIIHSPVGYFRQSFNKRKICEETNAIEEMLKEFYGKSFNEYPIDVSTSKNVSTTCFKSEVRTGGSKSRRRRSRRNAAHKTHRKRGGKRIRNSKSHKRRHTRRR